MNIRKNILDDLTGFWRYKDANISAKIAKEVVTAGGVYEVTLESKSVFGTFISNGKVFIAKLTNNEYDIKVVLYPENAPLLGISEPYYIHAIAKENPYEKTFTCSGSVYITKGFIHKNLEINHVLVSFDNNISSEMNNYKFSLNPFTIWGLSPGKITNTGTLNRTSKELDEKSSLELAPCTNLKI